MKRGFWRTVKKFSRGFLSRDNSEVYSPYAAMFLAFILATPIVILSCIIIITNFFIRGKPLDAVTVDLLKYMLGAATGGVISAAVSMFSKTMAGASSMFSKTTTVSQSQTDSPPKVTPAPTAPS